jgi:hypothetical protein
VGGATAFAGDLPLFLRVHRCETATAGVAALFVAAALIR